MVNSRRGVDIKLLHFCPHCHSSKIVKNGYHHHGKLQFFCNSCRKYFYEDSAKGYPPTSIPFPVITYVLYFRRRVPEFSNMRKYRKFVNYWLQYLKVSDQEVSRQTIHHWIKNYDKFLDKVISFSESRDFVRQRVSEVLPVPIRKPIPYRRTLKVLEKKFGKAYCIGLVRHNPVFFQDLVDIVSKHGVFIWEFLENEFGGGSVSYRPLPVG